MVKSNMFNHAKEVLKGIRKIRMESEQRKASTSFSGRQHNTQIFTFISHATPVIWLYQITTTEPKTLIHITTSYEHGRELIRAIKMDIMLMAYVRRSSIQTSLNVHTYAYSIPNTQNEAWYPDLYKFHT